MVWTKNAAAILSPTLGLLSGILTWSALLWHWRGANNIHITQQQLPGAKGAIVLLFSPASFSVLISLAKPTPATLIDGRILKLDLIEEKEPSQSAFASRWGSETSIFHVAKSDNDKS